MLTHRSHTQTRIHTRTFHLLKRKLFTQPTSQITHSLTSFTNSISTVSSRYCVRQIHRLTECCVCCNTYIYICQQRSLHCCFHKPRRYPVEIPLKKLVSVFGFFLLHLSAFETRLWQFDHPSTEPMMIWFFFVTRIPGLSAHHTNTNTSTQHSTHTHTLAYLAHKNNEIKNSKFGESRVSMLIL